MKRKIVGIMLREFELKFRGLLTYGTREEIITKVLRNYDVDVICIPMDFEGSNKSEEGMNKEFEKVKRVLEICDAIIFPGAIDTNEIDCKVLRYLHEIDKPTLGICSGIQLMGKAFGGEIVECDANEIHDDPAEYAHDIEIDSNSKLYEILGETRIKVNSRHHECVKHTNLTCSAKSKENIIEALEDKNKKFFV